MRKKWLLMVFTVVTTLFFAVAVSACKKGEEDGSSSNKTTQCVSPEIIVLDDGIYWADVENAESYYYNYNNGEWIETKESIAFPTTAGDYKLQLKAVDEAGNDGKITEFAFKVAKLAVACERVDNTLRFNGENIYFSVNGMEEGILSENNILDFSNDTAGTQYSVQYYAKGGYYSAQNATYYLDSDKTTQTLTVTQMLSTPNLTVNAAGTGIVWTASDNAISYAVAVDGENVTSGVNGTSIAFPTTEGEHTITVQAIGDGEIWYSSLLAEYKMTTVRDAIPEITYTASTNGVHWGSEYDGKIQMSVDGGDYAKVNDTSVTIQEGTSLKVVAYYDESEKTFYLESKPLVFETRSISEPVFSMDGYVVWNQDDDTNAKKYCISLVETTQESQYTQLNENVKNISFLDAGDYVFSVYATDYIEEQTDKVVFYLPSESKELTFSVLAKPSLSFEQGKLLWEVDTRASSYEYRMSASDEWETAADAGYLRTRDMATYEVRAVGSDEVGKYALTSEVSSLFFDPELKVEWGYGKSELALFDQDAYEQVVSSATSANATRTGGAKIIANANNTSDESEKAILEGANGGVLKVTAGNSAPRLKAYWGNSDGATIELFQPIKPVKDARIIFRVYIVPNSARRTAYAYNYSGEYLNNKGRTIDEYGNTYAFFDEGNNLVGYQNNANKLIDAQGNEIGTVDTKTLIATVTATGVATKARTVYGVLDDNDNLLGVADENGIVKNGETVVGTLNDKGELIVNGATISTSAVRKTNNMEGKFIVGVTGNAQNGGFKEHEAWYTSETSALPVGEWTEVSFTITEDYTKSLADICYVYIHFFANAQEGDTFYVDSVRYDENAMLYESPENWVDKGDDGSSYYSVKELSWFKPSITSGEDEHGEYIDFDWTGCEYGWGEDALTFYFDNIQLNAGDKVYIRCNAYKGRWTQVYINETSRQPNIVCADVTGGELYQEKLCFTASETFELTSLSIRPEAWRTYDVHFRIYGVYIVRAE